MIFGSAVFCCYPLDLFVVNIALASVDGYLAFIALYQLTRIHMRNQLVGWTRQKVLHFLIGSSSLASPDILFLAVFLLLLSFWVDLCHQGNDEEDDDEEISAQQALLDNLKSKPGSSNIHERWRCCPLQGIHVGSWQNIVIVVYVDIFATAILLFGGSLGCYGLQLFCKLKRVRSERTSSEMGKFSYHWNLKKMSGVGAPLLLVLYYFIGDFLA